MRPPVPFPPWGAAGPPVLHDGFGLETEPEPPALDVPCPRCERPVAVDVAALLAADPVDADAAGTPGLAEALGLVVHEPMPGFRVVADPLGLRAYLLPQRCTACAAPFGVVAGYGEYQPARWVATFLGLTP